MKLIVLFFLPLIPYAINVRTTKHCSGLAAECGVEAVEFLPKEHFHVLIKYL
jgi:hypothetical protein